MATWKLLTNDDAVGIWDQTLIGFEDSSAYQSYAWGEYRRALGWEPCRWVALNEKQEIVAMMQGVLTRYPFGLGLVWSEGGPVGDLSVCDESLQTAIRTTTNLKRVYCRFRCDRPRSLDDVWRLKGQGWSMSWSPLTSNYSMAMDLSQDEDRLMAACDRNFRRNLRRAHESNLTIDQWLHPDVDEVLSVYASMQELKGIDEQLSREEIKQMLKRLKERIFLYRCTDELGKVVSLMGVLVVGDKAFSLLWATSEQGRKLLASYRIFWAVVQHCQRLGVRTYDLAGIDPVRNPGVYRFKRATGAVPVEYLGEWDWANQGLIQWFGNWSIAHRGRLKQFEAVLKQVRIQRSWFQPGRSKSTNDSTLKSGFASVKPLDA
jgi:lipid II:glycine glycyltransferase (peptidoglycan interpeptide bridge formation enzyme)